MSDNTIDPPPSDWVDLVDVIQALQSSVQQANQLLHSSSQQAGRATHLVVGEISIQLAAEVMVDNGVTRVRFPATLAGTQTPMSDAQISRVSMNLRPMPVFQQEPAPQPADSPQGTK